MMWTLIIPQDVFCVINVQPFPFTIQTFRLPLGNYSTNKCGFFLQNLMFFLHLCTLMHVFAKITLFKHVYIKNWLNINQCKNMIHTCHMHQKKIWYTFLFHPNMLILKLPISGPHLHSIAFKSNRVVSLHKFFVKAWNGIIQ